MAGDSGVYISYQVSFMEAIVTNQFALTENFLAVNLVVFWGPQKNYN